MVVRHTFELKVPEQRSEEPDFTFGEWQWRGHELNSFAVVRVAAVPAISACGGHCRGQQKDERRELLQRASITA